MCFAINYEHPKIKIAEKDIRCYRMFEKSDDLKSPFRGFIYQTNKRYTQKIAQKARKTVSRGFHSYSVKKACQENMGWLNGTIRVCTIPKGSQYYYNPLFKEYVSNQIIIKGKVK